VKFTHKDSRYKRVSVVNFAATVKFKIMGAGASKPVANNSSLENRAKNRRVEILVE